VSVVLQVPPADAGNSGWAPVTSSDRSVLEPVSNGAVTLVKGVTATFLKALRAGVVTLSSTGPGGRTWSARVVVSD
jgi:hypothetical protein